MKNEEMSLPTPEQIRVMIKTLHDWGKNTEGKVPVHDANALANLVVRLYGFSSWMEYLTEFKREKKNRKNSVKPQLSTKKIDSFSTKKIAFSHQDNFFSQSQKIASQQNYELVSSHDFFSRFILTHEENTMMKTEDPVYLRNEMAIFCGNDTEQIQSVKTQHLTWLKENHQAFVAFGFNTDKDKLKGIKKIGQNGFKIDPLNESMDSDGFELFMGLENTGKNAFLSLWFMMVRCLKEEYNLKWSAEDLIHSLSLSFIIGFINHFNRHFLSQALQQYLTGQCNIQIENEFYVLSPEAQKIHYVQIYEAEDYLKNLAHLYHENYFSYDAQISFKEVVFTKSSVVIETCDDESLKQTYCRVIHCAYYSALQLHKKELSIYNPKKFVIWSLWNDTASWMTEDITQAFSRLSGYTHLHAYVHDNCLFLESWFKKTRQVILFKQLNQKFPASWKEHMLNVTEKWDVNMWLNDCHVLQELESEQMLYWSVNEEYPVEGLETFFLKKISLKNSDISDDSLIPDYP